MKKTFLPTFCTLAFSIFFFIKNTTAQTWQYEYNNNSAFSPHGGSQKTTEGSYIFFHKGQLLEMSEYGEPMYFYPLDANFTFFNAAFVQKETNGYLTAGAESSPLGGDFLIKKMDFQGNILWKKEFVRPTANTQNDKTPACTITQNERLFVAAIDSIYLLNTTNGDIIWRKPLLNISRIFVSAFYENDEILLCGRSGDLFTLNENGDILKDYGFNTKTKKAIADDNNYIVVGKGFENDAMIRLINKNTGEYNFISYGSGELYDIKITNDGGFILAGTNGQDAILIKTNDEGVEEWRKNYGDGVAKNVEIGSYEGYVINVYKSISSVLFIKTDKNGNTANSIQSLERTKRGIDISNIRTAFGGDGTMFSGDESAYFQAPKTQNASSISSSGLWMGGYDNSNNLRTASFKGDTSRNSYSAGYINDNIPAEWMNKVWKVNQSELQNFIHDISDNELTRPIPHDILTWPAVGNPHFKGTIDTFLTITEDLAPFFDHNEDGIYNVYDGDYPIIKGDEMLLWIMNDADNQWLTPINTNIIGMAYGYDCPSNENLYNTLFVEYTIKNKSNTNLKDFVVGMWLDLVLGCSIDDNHGTDTLSNSIYIYNEQVDDSNGGCGGFPNYGTAIPIQSVSFLNQKLHTSMVYYPFAWSLDLRAPSTDIQHYNYLTGFWNDGTPLYNTGSGYQELNADITKYAFTGNPSDNAGWSFCTDFLGGSSVDRIMSSEPFDFDIEEEVTVSFAYTFHENIPLPCPDISVKMRPNINAVQAMFESDILDQHPNLGLDKTIDKNSTLTLSSNYNNGIYQWSDGSNNSTLEITEPGIYSVTITDENGCQKTDQIDIYDYTPTNLIDTDIYLKAFPNPVNDVLTVDFEVTPTYQNLSFHLTNTLGQIVLTESIENTKGMRSFSVGNLATGVYFLTLLADNEVLKTEKIVVE
jgi:hypothetical protein